MDKIGSNEKETQARKKKQINLIERRQRGKSLLSAFKQVYICIDSGMPLLAKNKVFNVVVVFEENTKINMK